MNYFLTFEFRVIFFLSLACRYKLEKKKCLSKKIIYSFYLILFKSFEKIMIRTYYFTKELFF